jgi:hypothetical protein
MSTPARPSQITLLQNMYWDLLEENAELKTSIIEKDELIARLRRELNAANHKMAKLHQLVDMETFLATSGRTSCGTAD